MGGGVRKQYKDRGSRVGRERKRHKDRVIMGGGGENYYKVGEVGVGKAIRE